MNKKNSIKQTPILEIKSIQTTKGNKYEISKSNIRNKIATIQNLTLNSDRESLKGLNPHSYIVNFSASSSFEDRTKDRKKIIVESTILNIKNIKINKQFKLNIVYINRLIKNLNFKVVERARFELTNNDVTKFTILRFNQFTHLSIKLEN